MCGPAQVTRDFLGQSDWIDDKNLAAVQEVRKGWRTFAREFVKRKGSADNLPSRPKKIRRTKTVQWVAWTDNALRHTVGHGWSNWKLPRPLAERGCPFTWPRMTVALDEGSDGKSAVFGLQSLGVNVEAVFDCSHGVCTNYLDSVKKVGEWPFLLLCVITFNMPHMPYDEDRFLHTILNSMENYWDMIEGPSGPFSRRSCPATLPTASCAIPFAMMTSRIGCWSRFGTTRSGRRRGLALGSVASPRCTIRW